MPFQNTYPGFLYRQFFLTPAALPSTLSLRGKAGMVTGSNTGLGFHASAQLLDAGLSRLILAVRDVSKGEAARRKLLASLHSTFREKTPVVEVWALDLGSYASITRFAQRVKNTKDLRLDFAILNAGVAKFEHELNNSTQHEVCIQTNWLSTALLAMLLVPILQSQYAAAREHVSPPVLSIVGSETAAWAKFNEAKVATRQNISLLRALDDAKNFDSNDRYYCSKLLLQCFFMEFVVYLSSPSGGANQVVVNMVNPGFCYGSELHREANGAFGMILGVMKRMIGRSTPVGARTLAHAAVVASSETHGKYLSDERIVVFADYVHTQQGLAMRKRLWKEMMEEFQGAGDVEKIM